jgi:hypothetical protein
MIPALNRPVNWKMKKTRLMFSCLKLLFAGMMVLPTAGFAQSTNEPAAAHDATAGHVIDWTSDGTRDRLLANAEKYLGNVSERYIALPPEETGNKDLVATQFAFAFDGFPGPEIELSNGDKLFIGSDPESLVEKALLVTGNDRSTIHTLAILHRSCVGPKRFDRIKKKFTTCPRLTTLTFFVHDHDKLDEEVKKDVVHWVKEFAKGNNAAVKKLSVKAESQFIRAVKVELRSIPE